MTMRQNYGRKNIQLSEEYYFAFSRGLNIGLPLKDDLRTIFYLKRAIYGYRIHSYPYDHTYFTNMQGIGSQTISNIYNL